MCASACHLTKGMQGLSLVARWDEPRSVKDTFPLAAQWQASLVKCRKAVIASCRLLNWPDAFTSLVA